MFDFFKRKGSNSSEVNLGLPTTNVAIPILENVDVPILRVWYKRRKENQIRGWNENWEKDTREKSENTVLGSEKSCSNFK